MVIQSDVAAAYAPREAKFLSFFHDHRIAAYIDVVVEE